jgi:hypothetical protein
MRAIACRGGTGTTMMRRELRSVISMKGQKLKVGSDEKRLLARVWCEGRGARHMRFTRKMRIVAVAA